MKNFSWSLDISTTNVGMALWDDVGQLIELKHLQLQVDRSIPEENRYLHKAKLFKSYIKDYKKKIEKEFNAKIDNVFVEAPLPNTKVNINTTAKLLGFNGIACYLLDEIFGTPPLLISVYDSRKLFCPELIKKKKVKGKIKETLSFPKNVDKKQYIWKKVDKLEPNIKWFYKKSRKTGELEIKDTSYDMSDAYAVGFAGLKVMNVI